MVYHHLRFRLSYISTHDHGVYQCLGQDRSAIRAACFSPIGALRICKAPAPAAAKGECMNAARLAQLIAISSDRADLDRIARPDTALAIWWRGLSDPLRVVVDALDLDAVDNLSVEIEASGSISNILRSAGYSDDMLAPLSADVDLLIRRHAALTGEDRMHVRIEVIEGHDDTRFGAYDGTLRLSRTLYTMLLHRRPRRDLRSTDWYGWHIQGTNAT